MNMTFRATPGEPGGGLQLQITSVKKNNITNIKTIHVDDSTIADMKAAEKGTCVPIGNPGEEAFLEVEVSKFVELCVQLSQSTGAAS